MKKVVYLKLKKIVNIMTHSDRQILRDTVVQTLTYNPPVFRLLNAGVGDDIMKASVCDIEILLPLTSVDNRIILKKDHKLFLKRFNLLKPDKNIGTVYSSISCVESLYSIEISHCNFLITPIKGKKVHEDKKSNITQV